MKVPQAAVLEDVSSSAAMPCRKFIQGMGSPACAACCCVSSKSTHDQQGTAVHNALNTVAV